MTGVQKSFIDLGESEEEEEEVDVGRVVLDGLTAAPGTSFIGTIMVRSHENHMTL